MDLVKALTLYNACTQDVVNFVNSGAVSGLVETTLSLPHPTPPRGVYG